MNYLKETVIENDTLMLEVEVSSEASVKVEWSKSNDKLVRNTPLAGSKHIV